MDWPSSYAQELAALVGNDLTLDEKEIASILALARKVAHSTERRYAPLTTYLVGLFVAMRRSEGIPKQNALAEAEEAAARLIANLDALGPAVDVESASPEETN